jgi:hypothetical protein
MCHFLDSELLRGTAQRGQKKHLLLSDNRIESSFSSCGAITPRDLDAVVRMAGI